MQGREIIDNIFEDKKGFAFITHKGTHFISYWNKIDGEWNFINLNTNCIEIKCDRQEWNTTKDYIVRIL